MILLKTIDFKPDFRIYDDYQVSDMLDYRKVSDSLSFNLKSKFEVLHSIMSPDDFGPSFKFAVRGEKYILISFDRI